MKKWLFTIKQPRTLHGNTLLLHLAWHHFQHQCLQHQCTTYISKNHTCKVPVPSSTSNERDLQVRENIMCRVDELLLQLQSLLDSTSSAGSHGLFPLLHYALSIRCVRDVCASLNVCTVLSKPRGLSAQWEESDFPPCNWVRVRQTAGRNFGQLCSVASGHVIKLNKHIVQFLFPSPL